MEKIISNTDPSQQLDLLQQALTQLFADPRTGPAHVSVYMAVYFNWINGGCQSLMEIRPREIMPRAKISSSATWHRIIRSLAELGYLRYYPSQNKNICTAVALN